jgi:hypothetical protein
MSIVSDALHILTLRAGGGAEALSRPIETPVRDGLVASAAAPGGARAAPAPAPAPAGLRFKLKISAKA